MTSRNALPLLMLYVANAALETSTFNVSNKKIKSHLFSVTIPSMNDLEKQDVGLELGPISDDCGHKFAREHRGRLEAPRNETKSTARSTLHSLHRADAERRHATRRRHLRGYSGQTVLQRKTGAPALPRDGRYGCRSSTDHCADNDVNNFDNNVNHLDNDVIRGNHGLVDR